MRAILAALTLIIPTAGSAADQFDLTCSGTVHYDGKMGLAGVYQPGYDAPFQREYRIDLMKQRYCTVEACSAPLPIARVSETMLTLEDRPGSDVGRSQLTEISRVSGEYRSELGETKYSAAAHGKGICVPAPYMAIPAPKQIF